MSFFKKILGKQLEPQLMEAIDANNFEKTLTLLKEGANVNYQGEKGNTPLIRSLTCEDQRIFKLLINSGANINLSTNNGYTPLLFSCMRNNTELVKYFIAKGSNIHQKTKNGWTAITLTSKNPALFFHHCQNGENIKLAQELIDVTHKTTNYRTEHDPSEIIRLLLNAGADPNSATLTGSTALMEASRKVNFKIIQLLLDKSAIVDLRDEEGNTALHYAVGNTVEDYIKDLFDLSLVGLEQTIGESFITTLITAMRPEFENSREKCVEILLNHDANVNVVGEKGKTVLMNACYYTGNVNVVKKLVEAGADISSNTSSDLSPILSAAVGGHNDIIEYLLSKGMDIDTPTSDGETPLMTAVWLGHVDTVKLLIQNGANIKCKKNTPIHPSGEYPLEWAAIKYQQTNDSRYKEIGLLLIDAGATLPEKYR